MGCPPVHPLLPRGGTWRTPALVTVRAKPRLKNITDRDAARPPGRADGSFPAADISASDMSARLTFRVPRRVVCAAVLDSERAGGTPNGSVPAAMPTLTGDDVQAVAIRQPAGDWVSAQPSPA